MNKQYTFAASVLSDLARIGSEEIRLEAASTLLMTAHMAGRERTAEAGDILKEVKEAHDNLFDQIGHVLSQTISQMEEDSDGIDWNNSNEIDYLVNAIRPLLSKERGIIELELPQGDERELVIMMDTLTEGKRLLSVKIEDNVEQKQNKADADALKKVTAAIHKYYEALDTRQHGGIAQNVAMSEIQDALSMSWGMPKKG